MARIELTQRLVTEAKCAQGKPKADFFDTRQTGFFLEVRASGGKTFYQRYTDERGATKQFKIGSAEFINLSEARLRGKQIVSRALLGDDPQKSKAIARSIPSLRQFSQERYLPHIKTYKRSWSTDETILRVHVLPKLGHLQLDRLGQDEISRLLELLRGRGYTPSGTINRTLIVLRHIYNLALKWKVPGVLENPTNGLILAPDVCRQRFLTQWSSDTFTRLLTSM